MNYFLCFRFVIMFTSCFMMGKAHGLEICGARWHINALFLAPYFGNAPNFLLVFLKVGSISLWVQCYYVSMSRRTSSSGIPAGLSPLLFLRWLPCTLAVLLCTLLWLVSHKCNRSLACDLLLVKNL